MPKTVYVIKFDANTELYLLTYSEGVPTWGSKDTAITFGNLADANAVISMIGSGPIGVPK